MLISLLVTLASAAPAHPSSAVPFVGIQVWDLASYPSCDSNPPEHKICINKIDEKTITVDFRNDTPSWMAHIPMFFLVDGKPIGATVDTNGIDGQEKALEFLKERYGRPASLRVSTVHNAFNAHYQVMHATWRLKDGATVKLDGATDTLDAGQIQWLR